MGRRDRRKKRFVAYAWRPDKKRRRQSIILCCLCLMFLIYLVGKSIKAIMTGEGMVWENWQYQPVGPGYVVILIGVLIVAGVAYLWERYIKRKPDLPTKKKRPRNRPWPPHRSYPW
jgi:hypothetical protein